MRRTVNFRTIAPYALLAPGLLWLALFYVYPAIQMFLVSLWTGNVNDGFQQTWNWGIYPEAVQEYWPWIARSIVYGGLATILAFALGYPLAYAIAFRGGAYKNLLLFLVIAPFFTSFLLRTISWKIILSDNGIVLGPFKDIGLIPADFQLLATPAAVIAGITYNFLPFMTLPLYVALEKVDRRLIEAAEDLYAGPWRPRGTIVGGILGGVLGAVVGLVMGYGPRRSGSRAWWSGRSSARSSSARRSSGSSSRCPCPESSPAPCSCSSRRWAITSTPSCSATRSRS